MASTAKDARDLFHAMPSAYAKSQTRLKVLVSCSEGEPLKNVVMAIVGTFPFNAFLQASCHASGHVYLEVNPAYKGSQDTPPKRAFADSSV